MKRLPLVLFLLFGLTTARAVIVYGTNGSGSNNTSAPADDPGWNRVGTVGGATAVYLGSQTTGYWMITANHVSLSGNVSLNGGNYSIVTGSAQQIGTADLKVFRISSDPGLSGVTLATTAPGVGSSVVMIGNGRDRGAEKTWDGNSAGWSSPGSAAAGYEWGTQQVVRWGSNVVQNNNVLVGSTSSFATVFNDTSNPDEAQASAGDSGGAVFSKVEGLWQLTGIMFAVGEWTGTSFISSYAGEPSGISLYYADTGTAGAGGATFSVKISSYRSAIMVAIPEPGTVPLVLLTLGALPFWIRGRRRARS